MKFWPIPHFQPSKRYNSYCKSPILFHLQITWFFFWMIWISSNLMPCRFGHLQIILDPSKRLGPDQKQLFTTEFYIWTMFKTFVSVQNNLDVCKMTWSGPDPIGIEGQGIRLLELGNFAKIMFFFAIWSFTWLFECFEKFQALIFSFWAFE